MITLHSNLGSLDREGEEEREGGERETAEPERVVGRGEKAE